MEFRYIDSGYNTPSMNMAIDEALLDSKLSVLRFYQWKPAALSLGYFQKTSDINVDYCKKNKIEIVRRLTGGNAVLHDQELTYSFIIDEKEMPSSVIESYKVISKAILKALKNLGVDARMNENIESKEKSAVCFNDPSWYEIIVNNKKIVGSAQKRLNGKLLQHGSILFDIDIEKYAGCFKNNSKEMNNTLSKRITSINSELNRIVSYEELATSLKKGFENELKISFISSMLSKEEEISANKISKEKYSANEWNYKF
jgi:lipoyl(octanoyl) transferase